MTKLPVIACLIFIISTAQGQVKISGKIVDSTGTGIHLASVQLLDKNGRMISYTSSDLNGSYFVMAPGAGEYAIFVKALSYKSRRVPVKTTDSLQRAHQNIVLQPSSIALNEVIIRADLPIVDKKDTIEIKVKHFLTGSEEVAEDVLKRLPGISVSSDGSIQIQGQSVDKVLIEGDDLFDKGYRLLTRNLSASVIDKIQVLKNYSDNPVFRNIKKSNKVSLNISLKSEVKNTVFSNNSIGGGTGGLYDLKTNVINIKKKRKIYVLGSGNNRGVDISGDGPQFFQPDYLNPQEYTGDKESAPVYLHRISPSLPFSKERYSFNKAWLGSVNVILNPGDKLKIKLNSYLTTDRNTFEHRKNERLVLENETFENRENNFLVQRSEIRVNKLQWVYSPREKDRLEYVSDIKSGKFSYTNDIRFNDDLLNNDGGNTIVKYDNRLSYSRKINSISALQLTLRSIHMNSKENQENTIFLFEDFFPGTHGVTATEQYIRSLSNFFGGELTYYKTMKRANLEIDAGYLHKSSEFDSRLNLIEKDTAQSYIRQNLPGDFINQHRSLYGSVAYTYVKRKFQIAPAIKISAIRNSLSRKSSGDVFAVNVEPSLNLEWNTGKKNKILSAYRYSFTDPGTEDINGNDVLAGYRDLRKGLGEFRQLKGSSWMIGNIYGNWSDRFLLNGSVIYNYDPVRLGTSVVINPDNFISVAKIFHGREMLAFNGTLDVFAKAASVNLKINSSVSYTSYTDEVNGMPWPVKGTFSHFGPEIRSVFLKGVNFHLGSTWTFSGFKINRALKSGMNFSFLDLQYSFSETVHVKWVNELYSYLRGARSASPIHFSDISVKYVIKKNKLAAHIKLNNIFNVNSFHLPEVNSLGFREMNYRLQPRYVFMSFDIRI